MLHVLDLHHAFGEKKVLRGVSFSLEEGSLNALIGPSGGGKSVLLKLIAEIYPPLAGDIDCKVQDRADVDLMFQEGALFDSLTVFDNVAFPLLDGKVPTSSHPKEVRERIEYSVGEILSRVGLDKHGHKVPGQLSGGMRRRLSLARALVSKPKLALLDDPTCGLDPVASSMIMELIVELHHEYEPTMLLVSHDLRRLLPVAQRVLALFDGRISFEGDLEDLCAAQDPELRRFVASRYDLEQPRVSL